MYLALTLASERTERVIQIANEVSEHSTRNTVIMWIVIIGLIVAVVLFTPWRKVFRLRGKSHSSGVVDAMSKRRDKLIRRRDDLMDELISAQSKRGMSRNRERTEKLERELDTVERSLTHIEHRIDQSRMKGMK